MPIGSGVEAFDAANELLKLIVRRSGRPAGRQRVRCFHSWRAVLAGHDSPLDAEEIATLRESGPVFHLVGKEDYRAVIDQELEHRSLVLPLTTLQNPEVYRETSSRADFDIFFSCMFTEEHIRRKNVSLLYAVLDQMRELRVAWVGGYDPYERWLMEDAYNRHFDLWGRAGLSGEPPWDEYESSMCWQLGGGVFSDERRKQETLRALIEKTSRNGYRVQFYANLGREQVVHLLNRCRVAVSLSTHDQWPRSVTEALACGTPVVVVDSLLSGLEVVTQETGVVVSSDPGCILDGLRRAYRLNRGAVRRAYFDRFGLENGVARLVAEVDAICADWGDIVTLERPAETRFKRAVRARIASMRRSRGYPDDLSSC